MVKTKGARTIRWDDVRDDVQRLYVREGLNLLGVQAHLKQTKRFSASIRSYRSKINEWGFKKGSQPRSVASRISRAESLRQPCAAPTAVCDPQHQDQSIDPLGTPRRRKFSRTVIRFPHHRRTPSDTFSDVSSNHPSPYLGNHDSFDNENPPPLLGPQQDNSMFQEVLSFGQFSLSDSANQASITPGHSPHMSPRLATLSQPVEMRSYGPTPAVSSRQGIHHGVEIFPRENQVRETPPELNVEVVSPSQDPEDRPQNVEPENALSPPNGRRRSERGPERSIQANLRPPAKASYHSDLAHLDQLMILLDYTGQGEALELRLALDEGLAEVINQPVPLTGVISKHPEPSDRTLLYWAAVVSTLEVVEVLLEFGAKPDPSEHGFAYYTPLNAAIRRNDQPVARRLLEHGASVHHRDAVGQQPLHVACEHTNDPEIVSMLVDEYNAEVNAPVPSPFGKDSTTALGIALRRRAKRYGSSKQSPATLIVRKLLEAGADSKPFRESFLEPWKTRADWSQHITEDEKHCLLYFIRAGLNLRKHFIDPRETKAYLHEPTLGHYLLLHCPEASMDRFLVHELDPWPGGDGDTILPTLMQGCEGRDHAGHAELVQTLLSRGADLGQEDSFGRTPLDILVTSMVSSVSSSDDKNAISTLKALLGSQNANASLNTSTCGIPSSVCRILAEESFIRTNQHLASEIVQLLLSHYPEDMRTAPEWQQRLSKYLPITEKYLDYNPNTEFHAGLVSHDVSDLFRKAAQIVSMKMFIEVEFRKDKASRSYAGVVFVQRKLLEYGVTPMHFPTDFVLDAFSLFSQPLTPTIHLPADTTPVLDTVAHTYRPQAASKAPSPPTRPYLLLPSATAEPTTTKSPAGSNGTSDASLLRPTINLDTSFTRAPWLAENLVSAAPGWSPGRQSPNQAKFFASPSWSSFLQSPGWKSPARGGSSDTNPFRENLPPISELQALPLPTSR